MSIEYWTHKEWVMLGFDDPQKYLLGKIRMPKRDADIMARNYWDVVSDEAPDLEHAHISDLSEAQQAEAIRVHAASCLAENYPIQLVDARLMVTFTSIAPGPSIQIGCQTVPLTISVNHGPAIITATPRIVMFPSDMDGLEEQINMAVEDSRKAEAMASAKRAGLHIPGR